MITPRLILALLALAPAPLILAQTPPQPKAAPGTLLHQMRESLAHRVPPLH